MEAGPIGNSFERRTFAAGQCNPIARRKYTKRRRRHDEECIAIGALAVSEPGRM